jgi:hypothetical protein
MKYRKKPVVIEAMEFAGGAAAATPIIDWVLAGDGSASWRGEGATYADPNCPTPEYHRTHTFCPSCPFTTAHEALSILTLEGTMMASPGDWVIRGVQGEFYPCKPDIFAATYEPVSS